MRKVTVEYEVYPFAELGEDAQNRAVNHAIAGFMELELDDLSDNMKRAVVDAEAMRTPWFTGEYIWDYAEAEVLDYVKELEYLKNGTIFFER